MWAIHHNEIKYRDVTCPINICLRAIRRSSSFVFELRRLLDAFLSLRVGTCVVDVVGVVAVVSETAET